MADKGQNPGTQEPVFRVVRLVSTSAISWEDAARRGVVEAAKTNPGLASARVSDMDTLVSDGSVVRYRLKLELAVQIDRERPKPIEGKPAMVVKRYLIIANQTLAGDLVPALVDERAAGGNAEFHLLVPATRSKETQRLMTGVADPMSGYTVVAPEDLSVARERDREQAAARLETFLERLSDHAEVLTSEVAGHDPFAAVARVMERSSFDEIIISTLPTSVSRWLKMDLPSRIERAFSIPVVVINPPNQ